MNRFKLYPVSNCDPLSIFEPTKDTVRFALESCLWQQGRGGIENG